MLPKKCTAIKALLLLGLLLAWMTAHAGSVAGTVANLSGALLVRKADGTVRILSQKSVVEQGDTLVSEKDTYARIKFIDNSEITLRPNSQLTIDNFSYEEAKPENDSAVFSLIKGGLRAITGLLGKRNKERFGLNTPSATIGIRGTIFIVEYVAPLQADVAAYGRASMAVVAPALFNQHSSGLADAARTDAPLDFLPTASLRLAQDGSPSPSGPGGRSPGLYVQVLDGMIHLTNSGGSQNFSAGQFGYTPSFKQPPVVLPANPGMQFTPPASFSSTTVPPGKTGSAAKTDGVDCQVR